MTRALADRIENREQKKNLVWIIIILDNVVLYVLS